MYGATAEGCGHWSVISDRQVPTPPPLLLSLCVSAAAARVHFSPTQDAPVLTATKARYWFDGRHRIRRQKNLFLPPLSKPSSSDGFTRAKSLCAHFFLRRGFCWTNYAGKSMKNDDANSAFSWHVCWNRTSSALASSANVYWHSSHAAFPYLELENRQHCKTKLAPSEICNIARGAPRTFRRTRKRHKIRQYMARNGL